MKQFFYRHWKYIVIALIVLFVTPIIINVLYKIPAPFPFLESEWNAGDAIGLFAAVFASILAIIGVYFTIEASNEQLREDIRNKELPFIVVEFYKTKPEQTDLFSTETTQKVMDPKNDEYEEYVLRDFSFVIDESKINVLRHLNGDQLTNIKFGGLIKESPEKGVYTTSMHPFVYIHLLLENDGKGVAIHTRIGLNKKSTPHSERNYVFPVPLKVGEQLNVGIYADVNDENSSIIDEYELEMYYNDMYGNKYCQHHDIFIMYNKEKQKPYANITTEQSQELLERNQTSSRHL